MLAPTTTRGLGARTVATLIGCSGQRAVAGEADRRFVFCSDASLVVPGRRLGGPWETHNKNRVPAVTGDVIALGANRVQRARDGSMSE
jgi:hypothetical protein